MSNYRQSFDELRRIADQLEKSTGATSQALSSLSSHVPSSFTWQDLASELARQDDSDKPQRVCALRACLDAEPRRLPDEGAGAATSSESSSAKRQIAQFVARILSPIIEGDDDDAGGFGYGEDDGSERRAQVVRRCQSVADDGMAVLRQLGIVAEEEDGSYSRDISQVLCSVIAVADASQPWTTKEAAAAAKEILNHAFEDRPAAKAEWIVDGILKQYLRPLFARSRPATVTESGRRAAYGSGSSSANARDSTAVTESSKVKPWKYGDLRAISVFAWAVQESGAALLRSNWPLFTPVLLALLDDPDTSVRARGLVLLRAFIAKLPDHGSLLHNTGLDSVLADAVFPTLLFLPRLTPEKESLQLLEPAYGALLALAGAAGAAATATSARERSTALGGAAKLPPRPAAGLLDRILRDGIYAGYYHAHEHIRIVEELVRQAGFVVQAMGIYAVKHLKDLIPIYAGILTDPFAMRYKPVVIATINTLQTTISNCWPRLAGTPWQEEIIKILMLCWLNADEDEGKRKGEDTETTDLQAGLVRAADMLLAVMRAADVDLSAKIGPLLGKEPRLKLLFRVDHVEGTT